MKKTAVLQIAALMLCLCLAGIPAPALAEGGVVMSATASRAEPGGSVSVSISLTENSGFAGMVIDVVYDEGAYTCTDAAISSGFMVGGTNLKYQSPTGETSARAVFSGSDNNTRTGLLLSLTFTVKETMDPAAHDLKLYVSAPDTIYAQGGGEYTQLTVNPIVVYPSVASQASTVALPGGLSEIADSAFAGDAQIERVIASEGITTIGARAFANCAGLRAVHLPATLTAIGENAFAGASDTLVLYAPAGSYAQAYAQAAGIPFMAE